MKKIVGLLLILAIIFGTVGCTSQNVPPVSQSEETEIKEESEKIESQGEHEETETQEEPEKVESEESKKLIEEYGTFTVEDMDFYWERESILEGIPKPTDYEVVMESLNRTNAYYYIVNANLDTFKKFIKFMETSDLELFMMGKDYANFELGEKNITIDYWEEGYITVFILA